MGIAYNTSIVRNGLVLHLDAANKKSYPGAGTVWKDLSGNGNNGTITSVDYEVENNGSLLFNNANDTVAINHNDIFNFNSSFTVSTWIKVNSFSTSSIYNVISKKPSFNNTQKGWSCQYDYRTTGVLQFRNNDGSSLNDHTPTSNVNNTELLNQTDTWVNSIWAITSSNVTFYINGIAKGTLNINYSDTDSTASVYVGKTVGSIGDPSLSMNLSSVMIHNRALSAAEIRQNFEATRGRYGI
jgi:hypothetical protein